MIDIVKISVNGLPLPDIYQIVRVVVDTSIHMPGMFEIHLLDHAVFDAPATFPVIDSVLFKIGNFVSITAEKEPTSDMPEIPSVVTLPLIKGEITSLEAHFDSSSGNLLIVRGYDKSHRLHRGRKTKVFQMQTDSAIVQQIISAAGVMGTVMPTPIPREYVLQNNMTDMEFVRMLADRNGYDLYVNALGLLQFKKAGIPSGLPVMVEWGLDMFSFHPRVSSTTQVSSVKAVGYDPKTKMPVVGMMPVVPSLQGGATLAAELVGAKSLKPAAELVISNKPTQLMPEASQFATSAANRIANDFIQAEGVVAGNPTIKAGGVVMVTGVGLKYSGKYNVTSAVHTYENGNYVTTFKADGQEAKTFSSLVANKTDEAGRIYGVVNGVVTNNMDPLSLGRVKVKFMFLQSTLPIESAWCRVATPMAGSMRGLQIIPEVNDEVLVSFEQGDVNFPYVIGSVWNNLDRPPSPSAAVVVGGKVTKRIFKTTSGHTVTFNDGPGTEAITIVDKTTTNKIEIQSTQNTLTIEMLGNITIKSKTGDVSIECMNFSVKALADCKIEATANLTMKGTAGVKLDSDTTMALKAMATLTAEGTAAATFKNGSGGQVAISGPMVNINNGALEIT